MFDRFFEMLQMEPDMPDQAGAAGLTHVRRDALLSRELLFCEEHLFS